MDDLTELRKDFKHIDLDAIQKVEDDIAEKSSRFYELIPQTNYRTEPVPSIANVYNLNQMMRMIYSLLYVEVATKIILGSIQNIAKMNPIDYIFNALNIKMITLTDKDAEYQLIMRYIGNSHEFQEGFVSNIFAVERRGKSKRGAIT